MKWFKGNETLSHELVKEFNYLESKRCYDNIYFNLGTIVEWAKKQDEPIEVCFGYIHLAETNVAIRHCFLKQGQDIIDPTLTLQPNGFHDQTYALLRVFSVEEYLEALGIELNTDLSRFLRAEEQVFQQRLIEAGLCPIG